MFTKTKNKLKNKLRKWSGIEKLESDYTCYKSRTQSDINNIKTTIDNRTINLDNKINKIDNKRLAQINAINQTLQSVISIGADVVPNIHNDKSWAVVCIEGKMNVVKFIDMQGQDYRYIMDFLKQFECSRRVIDTPSKCMFEDYFVDFNK